MGETKEQHKARLEREGWRQVKGDRFVKVGSTEHPSTQSIMDKHYADSNIGTVDAQISQMEGDTPGGNR